MSDQIVAAACEVVITVSELQGTVLKVDVSGDVTVRVIRLPSGTEETHITPTSFIPSRTRRNVTHGNGVTRSSSYRAWSNMLARCETETHPQFKDYGGRGIHVFPLWRDFDVFIGAVGYRPSKAHSLDRIDNDLGYQPGNVRWALQHVQARNRRSNKRLTANGTTLIMADWENATGLSTRTIRSRIKNGMSAEEAVSKPPSNRSWRHGHLPKMIEFQGRTQTVAKWANEINVKLGTLLARLRTMSIERALTLPTKPCSD